MHGIQAGLSLLARLVRAHSERELCGLLRLRLCTLDLGIGYGISRNGHGRPCRLIKSHALVHLWHVLGFSVLDVELSAILSDTRLRGFPVVKQLGASKGLKSRDLIYPSRAKSTASGWPSSCGRLTRSAKDIADHPLDLVFLLLLLVELVLLKLGLGHLQESVVLRVLGLPVGRKAEQTAAADGLSSGSPAG